MEDDLMVRIRIGKANAREHGVSGCGMDGDRQWQNNFPLDIRQLSSPILSDHHQDHQDHQGNHSYAILVIHFLPKKRERR